MAAETWEQTSVCYEIINVFPHRTRYDRVLAGASLETLTEARSVARRRLHDHTEDGNGEAMRCEITRRETTLAVTVVEVIER